MTFRLSILILLLVWAALVAGGGAAYWMTRTVLLTDLDAAIVRRARTLPEVANTIEAAPRLEESAGDRYVIANHLNQTRGRATDAASSAQPVILHSALATLGDGSRVRTLTLQFTTRDGGRAVNVVYSGSAQRLADMLKRLTTGLILFGIAAGIAAGGLAVVVSRAALRPLRSTADAVNKIDEQKLDQRLDADALPDELQPLARQLNGTLDRIQRVFAERKQFLADASHELRTPVAALVTTLEVALRRPRDARELTRVLNTCMSDARMLQQLILALLEHARGEVAGALDGVETFDAIAMFQQCADVAGGLALEKGVAIRVSIPDEMIMKTQPHRIRGIVMNLLGNAVEYNRAGGTVELHADAKGGDLAFSVIDSGVGIAPSDLPHVFAPFYRPPAPASDMQPSPAHPHPQPNPHLGLGLFLVDSHIKALGGKCDIKSKVGIGTTISVWLPGVVMAQPVKKEAAAV